MKRIWGVVAGLTLAVGMTAPAQAASSSEAYAQMQVGVTYTVYEPSFVAGLRVQHVGGNDLCQPGTEENLLARYGKSGGRQFTITEGNPMCSDIGVGKTVMTRVINGATAVVQAYCDPASTKKCTKADVIRKGGHLEITLPAAVGLRPTRIWIETYGQKNISAQQLVQIAKSLKPVDG